MRAGLLRLPTLIPAAADRDLLRRFADARDEGAFAELVRRHGPLVLAVCRRVVSDSHLADDAFQATFVVLARKAATAGVGARLSTWLHSVAVKVSLRARTMAGRRAKRETLTAAVPERGIASVPPDDATAVLDEEIDRLPDHLRAAVVLCELRGVGRRDAAKELGIAEGTLSSRLAAARKKLAARLRARGVAPTVGIFSAISVSTDLAAAAVAVSTGSVDLSSHLAQLVEGGMQMTLLTKLKLAAVAVAVAVLTAGGFGGRWGNESAAAPVPKDLANAGIIWMFRPAEGDLVGHAPDGKKLRTVKLADDLYPQLFLGVTRDGQHALVAATKGKVPAGNKAGYDALHAGTLTVHLWPLHADAKPTDTGIGCQYWSRYVLGRDGKTLVVEHDRSDPERVPGGTINYETVAYDLTTFKGTKRPALEKGFWLADELANGDRILAFGQYGSDKRPLQSFHLLAAGSDKPKPLTGDDETDYCSLSPDGATLLVTRQFSSKSTPTDSYHRMFLLDRATGKAAPFAHRDNTQHAHGHWSPDGKRVVYEWLEEGPQLEERILGGGLRTIPISRAQVVVSDASGKTEKVILDLDGCPETDLAKAQAWHDTRPKLVGWYPARRNAPVPKPAAGWKEATPIQFDAGRVTSVAYSPSGKTLAVARDNGKLDFYDPATRKHITSMDVVGDKETKIATVTAVAFAPTPHPKNGDIFAVTHRNGVKFGTVGLGIFVDDAPKIEGIPPNVVAKDFDPHQLTWLTDADGFGGIVATNGENTTYRQFQTDGGREAGFKGWKAYRHQPTALAAIPNREAMLFRFDNEFGTPNPNDRFDLWYAEPMGKVEDPKKWRRISGHKSRPVAAAVTKNGKRIVTADAGGTLIVWDGEKLAFQEKSRVELGAGVVQLALAPDGKTVAVVRAFTDTDLFGTSGRTLFNLELLVFDVTDPPMKPKPLWSARNVLSDAKTFAGPASLAFGPDGKTLLAAFADPYITNKDAKSLGVKVWTLREPAAPKKNAPVPKLEGKIAVWQGDSVAVLSPDGKELSRHTNEEWGGEVASPFVRLSPDGTRIAMAGTDPRNLNFGYARILSADGKKVFRSERLFGAPWAAFWLADDNQFGVNATLNNYVIPADDGAVATAPGGGFNAILAAAPNGVQVTQHDPEKRTLRIGKPDAEEKDCYFVAEKDLGGAVAGVSRDGRTLLVVAGAKVQLFDPKTGDRETVAEHVGGCRAELASNGEAVVFLTRTEPKKAGEKPTFTLSVYDRATKETAVLVRDAKTPIRAVDWWSPAKADDRKKNAPVPKDDGDPGVVWLHEGATGKVRALRPNGDLLKEWDLPFSNWLKGVTPDGARFVYGAERGNKLPEERDFVEELKNPREVRLHTCPIDDKKAFTDLGVSAKWADTFVWAPDGKRFYRKEAGDARNSFIVTIYTSAGKELQRLTLEGQSPLDWLPDGTGLLVDAALGELTEGKTKLVKLNLKTEKTEVLFAGEAFNDARLSPDGKRLLGFENYGKRTDAQKPNKRVLIHDLAGKKTHTVIQREQQARANGVWSPDGTRIAYSWESQVVTPLGGGNFELKQFWYFEICDADGKNALQLFEKSVTATLLAWTPTPPALKNTKPIPPRKNAPVPVPPKEDTMGLTASVTFDKKEIMLGEPVHFTFTVKNPTDAAWQFEQGGDYRNRLGRPNSLAVTVTGPDGKAVPQPDSGMDMGGMSHLVKLPADGKAAFHPLFLPHWATFAEPGEYTVTVKRKVGLVPADAEDGFRAKATPVNLSATAKITVTPVDAKRMGELIDSLGKDMLDPKSAESDKSRKKMLAIRDPGVIPHFIELGKRPRVEARYAACEALGRFKTAEAFAELKKLYGTTGADLKGSAINEQLEDSSANSVRHSAIGAILECGHPDALAFGWKTGIDDGYYGVRMTILHKAFEVKSPEARKVIAALLEDVHESVRGEAKRYTDLLAKEKK